MLLMLCFSYEGIGFEAHSLAKTKTYTVLHNFLDYGIHLLKSQFVLLLHGLYFRQLNVDRVFP